MYIYYRISVLALLLHTQTLSQAETYSTSYLKLAATVEKPQKKKRSFFFLSVFTSD
jgi:hypothetical protein